MKNSRFITAFLILIALCAAVSLFIFGGAPKSRVAGIYQNGELIRSIDLDSVAESYDIVITGEAGQNVIHVSRDGVWVSSADCRDNTCVRHGPLGAGTPIVCLPNRLVIKWLSEPDYDAITGI